MPCRWPSSPFSPRNGSMRIIWCCAKAPAATRSARPRRSASPPATRWRSWPFSPRSTSRAPKPRALDPPQALWRVISGYDFELLVLIREGERTLFPPEDPLAMPRMWEEKLRTLIEASKFLHEGDFVNGWFPSATGEFYFECRRFGAEDARRETCIALNSRFIFPNMIAALNSRSRAYDGWAFRLRDPFDRVIWKKGDAPEGYESFMPEGGAARLGGGRRRRARAQSSQRVRTTGARRAAGHGLAAAGLAGAPRRKGAAWRKARRAPPWPRGSRTTCAPRSPISSSMPSSSRARRPAFRKSTAIAVC